MSAAPAKSSSSRGSRWWVRHRKGLRWATAWVPIAVILFLLIGFLDLVPVSFSGFAIAPPELSCGPLGPPCGVMANVTIPSGANVTVQWTDLSGGNASYWVIITSRPPFSWGVCGGWGPSYVCHFTSMGGKYALGSFSFFGEPNQTVRYTGTYYTSLL